MSTPSLLTSLLTLITSATQELQSELGAAGLPEPWIDHAALHPWDDETPPQKYWDARKTLISALGMMTAVVQNPREKLYADGMGYHYPATFNFIVNTHIPDILSAADVDERIGLPVGELSKRAGTHPGKTERVLRFLCDYHMFQETAPSTFANNKLSHCFKKGQPTAGLPNFWGDVAFRASTAFSATLRDPSTAHSVGLYDTSFAQVFSDPMGGNVKGDVIGNGIGNGAAPHAVTKATSAPRKTMLFDFLARPTSAMYCAAFAKGMITLDVMHGTRGQLDFSWDRWDREGAVYVDAGASAGHLSLSILSSVKYVKFINQDRPEACSEGEKYFAEKNPGAITSGRVAFQPNDFFTGQPVKGASIYILSNVLHMWQDKDVFAILHHISQAMTAASRLLVIEIVVVPAISQSRSPPPAAEEREANDAPWPLLKDYGIVNHYPHHQSMELMNLLNGMLRTLSEYVNLYERAGLELVEVHRIRNIVSVMEVKKKE